MLNKNCCFKKNPFLISIISAVFFLLAVAPAFADINSTQTQQIQSILNHWRERLRIPAVALSISLPDDDEPITFVSGTTALGGLHKITSGTLFQAGSISKSFTSMIILQLIVQGKIHLDDYITQYLPQYSQWGNVTIRELLNHTSGIFDYTKTAKFQRIRKDNPKAGMTPAEIVSMARAYPPYFPPGKGWKYSNTNYVLVGMIIEAVTHQSVGNIINYYLRGSHKLHLPNTFYLPGIYSSVGISRMAHGYSMDGVDVTSNNMAWAYTAGAFVSTTEDLLTWWQSLFQNNILPNQQLAEMMSLVCEHTSKNHSCIAGRPAPHLEAWQIDKRYGLGIIQSASGSSEVGTVWWHNGSTQGYKAIVMSFPKSNIYMSLMIDRDPGYLLIPNLPIIRNALHVLLTGSYTPIVTRHHHSKRRHHNKLQPTNKPIHQINSIL